MDGGVIWVSWRWSVNSCIPSKSYQFLIFPSHLVLTSYWLILYGSSPTMAIVRLQRNISVQFYFDADTFMLDIEFSPFYL